MAARHCWTLVPAVLVGGLAAAVAAAQEPAPVYEQPDRLHFRLEAVVRQEWTRDFYPAGIADAGAGERMRWRALPGLELRLRTLTLGVGGDFNWSSDDNMKPDAGQTSLRVQRDNYDSRDARLDLAFARFQPASWIRVEAGRFEFPGQITELLWDRDLRAQGAALTLQAHDLGSVQRLALTGLWARGGHVFPEEADKTLVMGDALVGLGGNLQFQLTASWLGFSRLDTIDPILWRQNTRNASGLVREYRVVDGIARLRGAGRVPFLLQGEVSRNTAVPDQRLGVWAVAQAGSPSLTRLTGTYNYAWVDRDATVAAFGGGDYLWVTAWEGHRLDLGVKLVEHLSAHAIGILTRFKDSPRPEERDYWTKRYRLELRLRY